MTQTKWKSSNTLERCYFGFYGDKQKAYTHYSSHFSQNVGYSEHVTKILLAIGPIP